MGYLEKNGTISMDDDVNNSNIELSENEMFSSLINP